MATKIDIMNDADPVAPGKVCRWQLIGGKPHRIEETIPTGLIVEKEEKDKVDEAIEIIKKAAEKVNKEVKKKGRKSKW